MKRFLPFSILIVIVVIFFRQFFFQNLLPIPSDTIVGLYNPFRDSYAKEFPRGIPFKNFLITDPVRQQYPWRFEAVLQERLGQLPLWNPYNFAGTPLMANQQSGAFLPFNLLFFILPFPYAWSLLIVIQPLLAGIFMYLYLKNLKLGLIPSIVGSIAFAFSGFFIAWLEWGTIDMSALWLPLIFLSVDNAFRSERKGVWWGLYFLSLIFSFLAGHLQTFFYIVLISHAYFILQWFKSKKKIIHLYWGLSLGAVTLILTSVQLFPLFQLILHSERNMDLSMAEGWFLPFQHLITFIVPDFFGNPTTLNYWGTWNYAELTGYIGIPALLFALFSLFRKSNRVYFFAAAVLLALLFVLPTPLAFLPFTLHIPFLSTAQPTRLMVLIDFSLAVLSGIGMDWYIKNGKKIWIPLVMIASILGLSWIFVLFHEKIAITISLENILTAKRNLIFPSSIFAVTSTLLILGVFLQKKRIFFITILVCITSVSAFDSLHFAEKFTPFTKKDYLFPTTKTIAFLQENSGIFRIMTTNSQLLPPNFSLMYHIQSLDGYDPLYIKDYGELIASSERSKPDIHEPFGFNRIITPHNYESRIIDLLGVKYVLSLEAISSPKLKKIFEEGVTKVYENTSVYPRAFFVDDVISENSQQKIINDMFLQSNNLKKVAIISEGISHERFSAVGSEVLMRHYGANEVSIQTINASNGFLVLTDAYYPTWHAYIDGKEAKIYLTDLALRGVVVPTGKHSIVFRDELF
ncbi:MAG TPA: YfhO family protein [Candidatus Eisenbacteria bacterium]|nr:YfhO family protein [Candidatus Eisenbacteria bacterium]